MSVQFQIEEMPDYLAVRFTGATRDVSKQFELIAEHLVLTLRPRATVWLCCIRVPPAFTFVLIFTVVFPFLEKWIEADCGENCRPLSQVAESRWILPSEYFFSEWSSDLRGAGEVSAG